MKRLLLLTLVCSCAFIAPSARAQDTGPALEVSEAALKAALHCPTAFEDAEHVPVLLVHGTFTDDDYNWAWNYLPALRAAGFDVCTVELPDHSLGDMQVQAEYVVYAVRHIAAVSGERVSMIGSSQGTLHPRWAVKWWPDVRAATEDIVFLAGPHHGTAVTALGTSFGSCFASCWQMSQGSNYIAALNAGDETPGDISYTSLYTLTDELVQPQLPESTSALEGATNIATQDVCPARPVDHVTISTGDAVGYALALDALTHDGPADAGRFDITTCAQPFIPGTNPADLFSVQGSTAFDGEYVTEEPPLKAYATNASAHQDGSTEPTPAQPSEEPEPTPETTPPNHEVSVGEEEVDVAGTSLPAAGANVLRLIATGLALVAAGVVLRLAHARRAARNA